MNSPRRLSQKTVKPTSTLTLVKPCERTTALLSSEQCSQSWSFDLSPMKALLFLVMCYFVYYGNWYYKYIIAYSKQFEIQGIYKNSLFLPIISTVNRYLLNIENPIFPLYVDSTSYQCVYRKHVHYPGCRPQVSLCYKDNGYAIDFSKTKPDMSHMFDPMLQMYTVGSDIVNMSKLMYDLNKGCNCKISYKFFPECRFEVVECIHWSYKDENDLTTKYASLTSKILDDGVILNNIAATKKFQFIRHFNNGTSYISNNSKVSC